jgi:hypothetical protein
LNVIVVEPMLAAEEVLANVGDLAFDVWFAGGVSRYCGVDDEPSVLGVLVERALERGQVTVGFDDRGFQIVDDHAFGNTAEELPGCLQTLDEIWDLLSVRRVNVLMSAEDQRDDEGVKGAAFPGVGIGHKPQSTEVDFGEFAR